jgi:GNAT superfamily N-acetyltransferase
MIVPDGYSDVPAGKIAAVVTSLEMRAPASRRPDPPADGWELRRAEHPDLDWYRTLFRRVGEDWLWFSRLAMADDKLAAIVHDPQVEVHALWVDGRAEGLVEIDFRAVPDCELVFFGVTAPLIGRGAGRWLMNRAIDLAWSRPITRFWVHTCTLDHPGSLGFYVRSGFTPFRRQIEVADDPRLTRDAARTSAPQIPIIFPAAQSG